MKTLTEVFLEKSRRGTYKDNKENRRLHRVGMPYGKSSVETKKFQKRNERHKLRGLTFDTTSMVEFSGDPKRKLLRKSIVQSYLNRGSRQGAEPVAVFMSGGAGSGKSTVTRKLEKEDRFYQQAVTIDSDEIKKESFKEDFEFYNAQKKNSAAARLHEESSIVADEVLSQFMNNGFDYIKDGTLKTYENAKRDILAAKARGYKVRIVGVTIPIEEAIRRAELRAERTGREVSKENIVKTHVGSTATYLQLIEDGIVDDMTLWDNTEKDNPRLIYDSKKIPPIIDEELFNRYKEKRNFVMTKQNNIEKAYDFGASEFNRKMKRIAQDRLKRGLPVSFDIPSDATLEDLEEIKAFEAWVMDGQPVED